MPSFARLSPRGQGHIIGLREAGAERWHIASPWQAFLCAQWHHVGIVVLYNTGMNPSQTC